MKSCKLFKVCRSQNLLLPFPLTLQLVCFFPCMNACLLTFLYTCLYRKPNCPVTTVNSNRPKSHTSHPLKFHWLYLLNFKFMILEFQGPYGPLRNFSPCGGLACFAHKGLGSFSISGNKKQRCDWPLIRWTQFIKESKK